MSSIDIRESADSPVDKIIFGENDESLWRKECYPDELRIIDADICGIDTIKVKDIPNLIKALQKAQELWGKK